MEIGSTKQVWLSTKSIPLEHDVMQEYCKLIVEQKDVEEREDFVQLESAT